VLDRHGLTRDIALRVSPLLAGSTDRRGDRLRGRAQRVVARPMAASLPLQLLELPLAGVPTATVQMVWNERTGASPAHVWLRRVVAEVGGAVAATCRAVQKRKIKKVIDSRPWRHQAKQPPGGSVS
jgi:hypothetical protein